VDPRPDHPSEIAEHFRTQSTLMTPDGHGFAIGHVLVDGPHAVVTGRSSRRVNSTGRSFDMMTALHMTVEDGLITRYHVYNLAVVGAAQPRLG
jgi:ketosteroid isomerase-like protein